MVVVEAEPSPVKPTTIYSIYEPPAHVSMPELIAELRRKSRLYRDAHEIEVIEALHRGELDRYPVRLAARNHNKIQDDWLLHTVGSHLFDAMPGATPTDPDFDGAVRRLAVGTHYQPPTREDGQLLREVLRKTPHSFIRVGDHHKFAINIGFTEANGALTAVEASPAPTENGVTVTDAAGIQVGDALRIALGSGFAITYVKTKSGNDLTFETPLASAPVAGAAVLVCLGEAGIFGNVGCDDTANSGTCFSRARLFYPKQSPFSPSIVGDMILVPA